MKILMLVAMLFFSSNVMASKTMSNVILLLYDDGVFSAIKNKSVIRQFNIDDLFKGEYPIKDIQDLQQINKSEIIFRTRNLGAMDIVTYEFKEKKYKIILNQDRQRPMFFEGAKKLVSLGFTETTLNAWGHMIAIHVMNYANNEEFILDITGDWIPKNAYPVDDIEFGVVKAGNAVVIPFSLGKVGDYEHIYGIKKLDDSPIYPGDFNGLEPRVYLYGEKYVCHDLYGDKKLYIFDLSDKSKITVKSPAFRKWHQIKPVMYVESERAVLLKLSYEKLSLLSGIKRAGKFVLYYIDSKQVVDLTDEEPRFWGVGEGEVIVLSKDAAQVLGEQQNK